MEPFIVSARKYRPETFEDVVGQGAITQTLENAIKSNHLAQALLFTGPRGVGKTTCARILAKKINHESGDYDPDEDFAFNIFELDAASNNGVDQIRSIVDQVRIPPQVGKYKIYIIDEVHMLSNAAFNAFLKTLEEPPAHAIFILATTEKHKIIPTILSRCQIFDFKRITVSAMREHLKRIASKEGIVAEEDALQIIAQKADGALRDSLSIFDRVVSFSGNELTVKAVTENLNVLDRETYFNVTDLLLENNIPQLLVDYDVIMAKGFDGQHFVSGLASHFRDLMVGKDERTIALLEVGEQTKVKYLEQAKKVDLAFLRKAIEIANQADFNYRSSRNQRLLVELTLMQLASITSDGEKKNDIKYIIPAVQFENAAVSEPTAPQLNTTAGESGSNNSVEAVPKNIEEQKPEESQKPIIPVSTSTSSPDSQSISSTNTSSTVETKKDTIAESLEEKRQALLNKSKKNVSGLSLQGIEAKKTLIAKQQGRITENDQLPEDAFTQEQLDMIWSKYITHLQDRGQQILASILNADQPQLKGTVIHLRFPNRSMKEDLEKSQGQILEYIKRELNNYLISFEIAVDTTVTKKYVYTDQDKFSKLVEKNPAVDVLRKTFDLDF
ncbi:DNA polymerase-3 subunit gamma/tau [Nonlabens dokdonensis]|uniref:DNA polymerase III subunit gamma/tau n=2 Tax=Nonlabens dokdonensis TaxID=328515 RepID=L7WFP6_NONDD|nr:DNA polymerase III subunit gamma/tau [Nonlabens dokdonensis]AGC77738.1 DNA polymerase III gamma/tau subunit [Nonlabens dokdonensis DSW-6]PZX39726.1 DNA polymerase-3 subunit gamma/tau [Nonlabens dokdonensis]